jgi:hypothetical protein
MIFGSKLNELHPKIVQILLGIWRFNRFFSKKTHFYRHFEIMTYFNSTFFLAIESMKRREPMGFFNISVKFLTDRVPSCRIAVYWNLVILAGLESRP